MISGGVRLYYAGCIDKTEASQAVGVVLNNGDDLFSFTRREVADLVTPNASAN